MPYRLCPVSALAATLIASGTALAQTGAQGTAGIAGLTGLTMADWLQVGAIGAVALLVIAFIAIFVWLRRRNTRRSYDVLLGGNPVPQQVLDAKGRSFYVNQAFEGHFGRNRGSLPELLRGQTDEGPDREGLLRVEHGVARGLAGSAFVCLNRGLGSAPEPEDILSQPAQSGRGQWVRVAAAPLSGKGGRVLWSVEAVPMNELFGGLRNDEKRRVDDLLSGAPAGYYRVDGEGRFLFANHEFGDWLGLDQDAMVAEGLRLHQIMEQPPEALPPPPLLSASAEPAEASGPDGWDAFGDRGQTLEGEIRLRSADGEIVSLTLFQDIDRDERGRVVGCRGVLRRPKREVVPSPPQSEATTGIRGLFQDAPIGIALLDQDGLVVDFNLAMRALAETAPASDEATAGRLPGVAIAPGVSLLDLVAEEDRASVDFALAANRAANAGMSDGQEGSDGTGAPGVDGNGSTDSAAIAAAPISGDPIEVRLADGERVCTLFLTPLEPAAGLGSGSVAHFLDTTEQKALETQISQSRKMQAVGQLAGGIAHDFNNLLTAMIGFSDLLLLRHRPGDQSFADVMQIKQNANRAANLVRQLLAFSRQQTLRPRVIDMTDILAELSHLLRRLIGENIELRMSHGRDLGKIKADQGQIEQVIINLAVNARDAMLEGGQLTIRTGNVEVQREVKQRGEIMPPGRYSCIEVSDTGHGIDPQHMDRIFEPFFSTKEVGAGTGLGLSTVYGIVKQSGGFVFAESELGVGTTFSIYLPQHEAAVAETTETETAAEPTRDLSGIGTVLLVEDEDGVRSFSARALRNKGYEVLEARSGDAALEVLSENGQPIDLLITDVVMPKVDGPTLVRQVREQRPDLKVIFISGYTEDSFRRRLDQDSGIHFLPKPFSLKQLAGKVKEVMRDTAA